MAIPRPKSWLDVNASMTNSWAQIPHRWQAVLRNGNGLADTSARGLGWASVGIGLAELVAPAQVEKLLGLENRSHHHGILRVLGIRELMHGVSILTAPPQSETMAASLWSRVAGDVLDTAVLAVAATKTKRPGRFAAVAALVMGIGLLDALHTWQLQQQQPESR